MLAPLMGDILQGDYSSYSSYGAKPQGAMPGQFQTPAGLMSVQQYQTPAVGGMSAKPSEQVQSVEVQSVNPKYAINSNTNITPEEAVAAGNLAARNANATFPVVEQPQTPYPYLPGKMTRTDLVYKPSEPPATISEGTIKIPEPQKKEPGEEFASFIGEKATHAARSLEDLAGYEFRNAPSPIQTGLTALAGFGLARGVNLAKAGAGLVGSTIEDPLGTPGRLVTGTITFPSQVWAVGAKGNIGELADLGTQAYYFGKATSQVGKASPIKPELSEEGIGIKLGYDTIPRPSMEGFKYGPKTIAITLGKYGITTKPGEVPVTSTGTEFMFKKLTDTFSEKEIAGGKAGLEVARGAYPSKGVSFEASDFEKLQAKTFTPKENAAIKQLIREEASKSDVLIGGSFSSGVEKVLTRQPKDYDITVKNPEAFAKIGLERLTAVGEGRFRLQGNIVEKFITTESGERQFVHGLDIHGFPEGYGAGSDKLGYGFKQKTPVVIEGEKFKLLNPGEQAARKGISALTPRKMEFAPEPHRMKDIGDFVTISETLIKEGKYPFNLGGLARPYSLAKLAEYKAYLEGKGIKLGKGSETLFAKIGGKTTEEKTTYPRLGGYTSYSRFPERGYSYPSGRYNELGYPTQGYSVGKSPYNQNLYSRNPPYGLKVPTTPQPYNRKPDILPPIPPSPGVGSPGPGIPGNPRLPPYYPPKLPPTTIPPYSPPPYKEPPIRPPITPPAYYPRGEEKKLLNRFQRGFLVIGRKGGKEFQISNQPLVRQEALSLGTTFVKSGAQQTFRIRPAGVAQEGVYQLRQRMNELYRPISKILQPKQAGEEVYTQKAKFKIGTRAEKTALRVARLTKRR